MDVIDHLGNILDCNEAFARFVGYSRAVLLEKGTTFLGLTHPDSLAASYKLMSPLVSGQRQVTRAVKKYICGDGSIKNSIVTCWLLHNDSVQAQGARTGPVPLPMPPASPQQSRLLLQAMIEEIPLDTDDAGLASLVDDPTVLDSIRAGPGAAPSAADLKGESNTAKQKQLQQQQQQEQAQQSMQQLSSVSPSVMKQEDGKNAADAAVDAAASAATAAAVASSSASSPLSSSSSSSPAPASSAPTSSAAAPSAAAELNTAVMDTMGVAEGGPPVSPSRSSGPSSPL
jgi:PAS domain S-box-containing protein